MIIKTPESPILAKAYQHIVEALHLCKCSNSPIERKEPEIDKAFELLFKKLDKLQKK
jgi:hypothetical protein